MFVGPEIILISKRHNKRKNLRKRLKIILLALKWKKGEKRLNLCLLCFLNIIRINHSDGGDRSHARDHDGSPAVPLLL